MSTSKDVRFAKRIVRKSGEVFTYGEVVACMFTLCTSHGWPEVPLQEVLEPFDIAERENIRTASASVLAEMHPDQDGYRQGYITTEEGDFERMMASPTITREFVEALCAEQ